MLRNLLLASVLVLIISCAGWTSPDARWISLGSSDAPREVGVRVSSATLSDVTLDIEIPGFSVTNVGTGHGRFSRIVMPGCGRTGNVGQALLPLLRKAIEIPQGATPHVEVLERRVTRFELSALGLPVRLIPVQERIPKTKEGMETARFAFSEDFYGSDQPYPAFEARIAETGQMRGHRFAMLEVSPVTYEPASGTIEVAHHIRVRVTNPGADYVLTQATIDRYASPRYEKAASKALLNYQAPSMAPGPDLPVGFLIMVWRDYYDCILPLAEWKNSKGYQTTVTKVCNDTTECGVARDSTAIRAYIKDAYENWDVPPSYVLLVGDTDLMPAYLDNNGNRDCWKEWVTDHYYSSVTDGDDIRDIWVGRLSCHYFYPAQLCTTVARTIRYEKQIFSETDWLKEAVFMAGDDQDIIPGDTLRGYEYFEGVNDSVIACYMDPSGYTSDKVYVVSEGAVKQDVTDSFNDGRVLGVYNGHGDDAEWFFDPWSFTVPNVGQLENAPKFPFIQSYACLTGNFGYGWCFGEAWLRSTDSDYGGLGFWGASYLSGYVEDVSLQMGVFKALFEDSLTWLGGMTDQGLLYYYEEFGSSQNWLDYFTMYNLLGDPSLDIWTTDDPLAMDVVHAGKIPAGADTYSVYVEDTYGPLEGAYVCLVLADTVYTEADTIYAAARTDAGGDAILELEASPTEVGAWLDLTVTCHDHVPVEDSVEVQAAVLCVHADYIGYDYPSGYGERTDLNQVAVTIDDSVYTTPVTLGFSNGDTVTVSVAAWDSLRRDDEFFGAGPFDSWSDAGARTHDVQITGTVELTVYFDPDVVSTRGCCDVACAVSDWADAGDTVMVHPGDHTINPGSGDPIIEITRAVALLSEEGAGSTAIKLQGSTESVQCRDASGFTIGDDGKGFTFWALGDADACIDVGACSDFRIAGNVFYGTEPDGFKLNRCVQIDTCTDVTFEDNQFKRGRLAIYAKCDTAVDVISCEFVGIVLASNLTRGMRFVDCDHIGIYNNHIETYLHGVKVEDSEHLRIGGCLDSGNVFVDCNPSLYYDGTDSLNPRVDAECNYWGDITWSGICSLVDDPLDRVDFVPWADSALTQTYVPFDPDSSSVAAPGSIAVCPQGDLGELEICLTVLDTDGDPVESMWCDDIEIVWTGSDPEYGEPYPCNGKGLFDSEKTDSNGQATVDWSHMGGCGSIEVTAIEDVPLSDTAVVLVNSPDLDGDGDVDLTDFITIGGLSGGSEFCADYDFDGSVDSSDIDKLNEHYLHDCPASPPGSGIYIVATDVRGPLRGASGEVSTGGARPVASGFLEFPVSVGSDPYAALLAVDVSISYDRNEVHPVRWDGGYDHSMVRHEISLAGGGGDFVRVVSLVGEHMLNPEGEYLVGNLGFSIAGENGYVAPHVIRAVGATADGRVIDLVAARGDEELPAAYSHIEYALKPTLETSPNPARGSMHIRYGTPLSSGTRLKLDLFDVRGRLVASLSNGSNDGLMHTTVIGSGDGSVGLSPQGVYFLRLTAGGRVLQTRKVVWMK